jgi:hypothetical protein
VPDRNPGTTGPTEPGWHPSTEQLRAFLAEDLDGSDAEVVADHLETCTRCLDHLDELGGPAVLTPTPVDTPAWDERRMRRSVRRTVLRTALDAALLLLVAAIALQLLGWFVLHPLLVDRGTRAPDSVAASIDVPVMTIPGAELGAFTSNTGVVRRTTEVTLQRAVGATMAPLGVFSTRLGPLGMTLPEGRAIGPYEPLLEPHQVTVDQSPVPFEPDRLGEGTAVTVELRWREPVDLETANAVADGADDLALLWVGFRVPGGDEPMDPSWRLGYSACGSIPEYVGEQRRGGFGGGGFRTWDRSGGAEHALDEVRRATANLAALGWPGDGGTASGFALADPATTAEVLASTEPGVSSVVITGPTQAVAEAVDEHAPDQVDLLELDFDRGAPEPCGQR